MVLSRVPGEDELFIGGIFTLRRGKAIEDEGITHVVSAVDAFDHGIFGKCQKRIVLDLDDDESQDILQVFAQSHDFIEDGLKSGGKVLVHCIMGISRSVTLVLAYLMRTRNMGVEDALELVRQTRSQAGPNDGFMEQLDLYKKMGCPRDPCEHPIYQRWLFQRELADSRERHQAPDNIIFEDEQPQQVHDKEQAGGKDAKEYRCRKCRRSLATTQYVVHSMMKDQRTQCSHVFVEPLSWMKPELEQGKLDGRLECPNPKCGQNIGKYAWQGSKCNCNAWIVPGISLHRSKMDEVKAKGPTLKPEADDATAKEPPVQGKI